MTTPEPEPCHRTGLPCSQSDLILEIREELREIKDALLGSTSIDKPGLCGHVRNLIVWKSAVDRRQTWLAGILAALISGGLLAILNNSLSSQERTATQRAQQTAQEHRP